MRLRIFCLLFLLAFRADAQLSRVPTLATVAGDGTAGYSAQQDGGAATAAQVNAPGGMAVDASGNIFFADTANHRVRRIDGRTGVISTVAGTGVAGYSAAQDGGQATAAQLSSPASIAVDPLGNLYIADTGNHRVRRVVLSTGVITTFAGNGATAYNQRELDSATAMAINSPVSITLTALNDVMIADAGNNRIFCVPQTGAGAFGATFGKIITVAGNGTAAYTTAAAEENVDARVAHLTPSALTWGVEGLYIGDSANHRLRLMGTDQKIKTVAGTGATAFSSSNNGALGTAATVDVIAALTHGNDGQIYFTDANQHVAERYQPSTGKVFLVAGNGVAGASTEGLLSEAQLNTPRGIALSGLGDVYIADTANQRIRVSQQTSGAVLFPSAQVAGAGSTGTLVFKANTALTITKMGITATLGGTQEFTTGTPQGCALNSALAAGSVCAIPVTFKPAYSGRRNVPITVETSAGNVNFGLSGVGVAAQAMVLPGVDTTYAGKNNNGGYTASEDGGPATSAKINTPNGLAVSHTGDLYIADFYNQRVRKVAAATGIITTVAGNGNQGYTASQDGGAATAASVWQPSALAIDAAGNLFITEQSNYRVRRVDGATAKISTIYGDGTSQTLYAPQGVAVDLAGNVYIGDTSGHRVWRWDAATGVTRLYGGRGNSSSTNATNPENGSALSAGIYSPSAMATDSQGNLYVASNDRVFKLRGDGTIATMTLADGTTVFSAARGLLVDANDNLIVNTGLQLQYYNQAAKTLTPLTASAITSSFGIYYSLAQDPSGNLFAGSTSRYTVQKIDVHSGSKTFATTGVGSVSTDSPFANVIANTGNAELQLTPPRAGSNPSLSTNFAAATSTTCPQVFSASPAGTIASGATCKLDINFAPQTSGAITGAATVTTNALNAATAYTLNLNGTATDSNPVTSITLTGLQTGTAGVVQSATVTAYAGTTVAANYRGTVTFTSTDAKAVLPPSYTFTAADAGTHVFSVTMKTADNRQTVDVTDVAKSTLTARQQFTVNAASPVSIAPNATSTPQSAQVRQQFSKGLGVVVKDQYGNGVPNITVTYAVPASGASASVSSATVKTDFDGTASTTATANSTTGTYNVTATSPSVTGTATFALTNTAENVTLTVVPTNTTRAYGQQVRLDATISPHDINNTGPTGSIVFYEGATVLGSVPLQNGVAGYLVSGAGLGVHQYSASYAGDTLYQAFAKTDATSTVTYTKAETAVQPQSFTVTVARPGTVTINVVNWSVNNTAATGFIKPGGVLRATLGTYNFNSGGTASTVPVVDGVATFAVPATQAAGHYTLRVSYPGDERYLDGGPAKDIDLTVTATAATVTIGNLTQTFDGSPKPVSVTTNPAGLSYTVTYNGSTSVPKLAGVYQVYASITDPNYTGNSSATLNIVAGPAAITWANPAAIAYGTPLSSAQLNASATINGTYTFTPAAGTILPPGTHTLNVVFTPLDTTYPPSSGSATIVVNKGNLTVKADNAGRNFGAANPAFTTVITGAVAGDSFTATATTAATATSAPGAYDIVPDITGANLDRYNVIKVNGTLTITGAVTTTAITSSAISAGVGSTVTFTATVASTAGTPTGNVEFFNGAASMGVKALSGGVASLSTNTMAAGTYTISARYVGDGGFASSTSATLLQTIVTPDFSITVDPASLTIRRGSSGTAKFTVTPSGGFNGTITLQCNTLPVNVTCTFAPATLTPNGAPVSSTVTIDTVAKRTAMNLPMGAVGGTILAGVLCSALAFRRRVPRLALWMIVSTTLLFGVTGCGSSDNNSLAAAGTVPVTVSAGVGSGGAAHTVSLTVNIVD